MGSFKLAYIHCLLYLTLLITMIGALSGGNGTFRAAVYEHAVIFPQGVLSWVNRSVALANMMKNVNVYKKQASLAGKQNVDILVFPEVGILGIGHSRSGVQSYLEYIPDPDKERWNPCDEPDRYSNTDIQHELSCMAKVNNMYVVANMGDVQPCYKATDQKCPTDGRYQFNTDVAFDSNGYLIAKYNKINLYFEYMFDSPPVYKVNYFDTPFGRFGLMTCFDILFEKPIIDLLENHGIENVAFPTAWMDSLPLLAAVQFHSAFAAGANVNFLSANIKYSKARFHGSGIYTPKGYASFFYSEDDKDKLLISDIPVIQRREVGRIPSKFDILQSSNHSRSTFVEPEFKSVIFRDTYTLRPVNGKSGNVSVCHRDVCCYLSFEKDEETNDQYALGARDGLHPRHGPYYMQVCILLKCKYKDLSSCGRYVKHAQTSFKYVRISGTFQTRYIYPEILLFNNRTISLSAPQYWNYTAGVLESRSGFEYPMISASMFGRVYERDHDGLPLW